jgi:hypothetical protein
MRTHALFAASALALCAAASPAAGQDHASVSNEDVSACVAIANGYRLYVYQMEEEGGLDAEEAALDRVARGVLLRANGELTRRQREGGFEQFAAVKAAVDRRADAAGGDWDAVTRELNTCARLFGVGV